MFTNTPRHGIEVKVKLEPIIQFFVLKGHT